MRQRGFALFEVMLAVALMAIAAAGSYTLVKSFRASSTTQQFIRYSTMITQGYIPFLNDATSKASQGDALSTSFLNAIGIPGSDQIASGTTNYSYVSSGMPNAAGNSITMSFAVSYAATQDSVNYFSIKATGATSTEVKQVLQSASSLFSIYCPVSGSALKTVTSACTLSSAASGSAYDIWLVYPKSGSTPPTIPY